MADVRVVLTTVDGNQAARKLAAELVERRLAACVNIVGPVHSIYRWQGKIESADEFLLIVKTTAEQAGRLEAAFKELHSYELPEHIELSVEGGSEACLSWIAAQASGDAAD
jgi:periplasmic divalent cation tolerance protein